MKELWSMLKQVVVVAQGVVQKNGKTLASLVQIIQQPVQKSKFFEELGFIEKKM